MTEQATNDRPDRVTIPIRVRYAECDPMQIAHHASYPVWMEMGRTELLRAQGANYRECEAGTTTTWSYWSSACPARESRSSTATSCAAARNC